MHQETRDVHHVAWLFLLLPGIMPVRENILAPSRLSVAWVSPPAPKPAHIVPSHRKHGPFKARVRTPTLQAISTNCHSFKTV